MTGIYSIGTPKRTKVASIAPRQAYASISSGNDAIARYNRFWDLMETVRRHGYMRAAMSVIGRSAVGAGWSLRPHFEYGDAGTERQRRRLMRFYLSLEGKQWNNIKDFQGMPYKLKAGVLYLHYFGQCSYQLLRNKEGQAIGYDFLPGYMLPNVDELGNFKSPAFIQYPTRNTSSAVGYDAQDIIFITNPDWEGYPSGGTDMEAVSDFAIPTDIYLQTAAREYMKNRDRPEAFYVLSADVSDQAFDDFVKSLEDRYAGPYNVGKTPTVVSGELEIKELSRLPSDLPYQEARADTRQELLAVTGVGGAKLGLTDSLSSANLREVRREFHETTMIPLLKLIEDGFYVQAHVREFEIRGWVFAFNSPDFLNSVERATVHMRYRQMGVLTANEVRADLGHAARTDPNGDKFSDEAAEETPALDDNPQGNPPEGREPEPDDPAQVGEPTLDGDDPERGDQHDESTRGLLAELRQWKSFSTRRLKAGKSVRPFVTKATPDYLAQTIQDSLTCCSTAQEAAAVFNETISMIEEMSDGR